MQPKPKGKSKRVVESIAGGPKPERSILRAKMGRGDDGMEQRMETDWEGNSGRADRDDQGSRAGETAGHGKADMVIGEDMRQCSIKVISMATILCNVK